MRLGAPFFFVSYIRLLPLATPCFAIGYPRDTLFGLILL
ncbi:hypothetical protein yinte0001_41610 [Yersinia intermedia ATCC 29909]|nr:hypothetical protein yinte0001_41610 [Yersinia intermedia ATCC 29909]